MSDNEEIWFDPGHGDPERAAADLAAALEMRLDHVGDEWYVSTDKLSDADPVRFWGRVEENLDSHFPPEHWPDDYSIFSDLPLVWTVESVREGGVPLSDRARLAFDRMVRHLPWRAVLTHGVAELVAAFDPERGFREFPPGTLSDGRHRESWA